MVDIYLWIFKRLVERKELAAELLTFIKKQIPKTRFDEISINAIAARWSKWFSNLPEPTEDQILQAKEMIEIDEARRLEAITNSFQPTIATE